MWWQRLLRALSSPLSLAPAYPPPIGRYRAYTTEFDVTISADTLLEQFNEIVEQIPSSRLVVPDENEFENFSQALTAKRDELGRYLADLPADRMKDIAVSLLLDHSGSLRETSAWSVAATAEALADTLTSAGIALDVLGFTTPRWKGGISRLKWLEESHPPYPGRLNELLHIVHVDANQPAKPGPHHFPILSDPNLYKENIDGEALSWAYGRLIANARPTKILIVISDGAPVDDSTLASNWPTILEDHLRATVAKIVNEGAVQLAAIGVLFDVSYFYPNVAWATSNDKLPEAAMELVQRMIGASPGNYPRPAGP